MNDIDYFRLQLSSKKNRATEELAKFKERLESNPLYAFQWGDAAIKAAARLQILNEVIRALDGDYLEDIRDTMLNMLHIDVQQPGNSTSMSSNSTQFFLNAARSEMIEMINTHLHTH